ncbi:Methyltransferase-like protein 22 [Linnemannia gamsii]|uniref:Methyltransferase-like protein 22 n=1 Tax=Linnemannia gamsii TaxID=64522 RepID=A0A9P6UQB4_9FUNG|nr:Methyltransferase-like protein 22 [Linnemannia gamsii]
MAQGDENDKDEDEHEEESDPWDYAVEIKHAMGTDLRGVGSQVWMGSFLLIDWIVHIQEQLNGTTVLEIGAGTGLASIAANLLIAADRVFCTDYDSDILQNCMTNVDLNSAANDIVKTRRLNWLMDDPLELMEEHQDPDPFGWSSQERQDWKDNGAFILAADVVYDDSLTDALVHCLEKLLSDPLPFSHPRYFIGRVAYMTMEKRYNFSLDQLAVVAQAYEYFKVRIGRSLLIEAEEIDVSTLTRHCDYDRTKDLVLFRIGCKD